jgi:hypothetical protein
VTLWRNLGSDAVRPANWVAIRLRQPAPNVDAIGAWLEVRIDGRSTMRQITIGGGHAGGSLGWVHLGLGEDGRGEVRVTWPDGEIGPWLDVEANRFAIVERGADEVEAWTPNL